MPEYKKEYMKSQICPIAEVENDRRLLFESDHRMLANLWTRKDRKGRCRRCKNRATTRFLSAAYNAADVCRETEKALYNKSNAEKSFERVTEMLVSVTEMAWLHGEKSGYGIQKAEDAVNVCEKAAKEASSAARASITFCEHALGNASGIISIMKKADEATKVTRDAALQAKAALSQVEKMKNEMEESVEVVDHLADRRARELGSTSFDSKEDYSVEDVCDEIDKAEFYQTLAENAMKNATKTAKAMNEMSKDYSHYKDVQKIIKKAQECYDKVEKEKDDTTEKMEKVKEQCEKAKENAEDASNS